MNIGWLIFIVVLSIGFVLGSLATFVFMWWWCSDVELDEEDFT